MIIIKLFNCTHQERRNQNYTITLWKWQYGYKNEDDISDDWVKANINGIIPRDVKLQKNTTIKIMEKRK